MTIENKLAHGNICELDTVMAREEGKEVQYHQYSFPTINLSATDILGIASGSGEYEIQKDERIVKGKIYDILYSDPFHQLGYLHLTFEEYVEQGRPKEFERTLVYEPIEEERK